MEFRLYTTTSDTNTLEKTLTNEKIINGDMASDFDVLEPDINIASYESIYNYCFIPKFNRYYYIEQVSVIRRNMYKLSLRVDVLMTYKDAIKEVTATVETCENYNHYDTGNNYNVEARETVTTKEFQGKFNETGSLILITMKGGI